MAEKPKWRKILSNVASDISDEVSLPFRSEPSRMSEDRLSEFVDRIFQRFRRKTDDDGEKKAETAEHRNARLGLGRVVDLENLDRVAGKELKKKRLELAKALTDVIGKLDEKHGSIRNNLDKLLNREEFLEALEIVDPLADAADDFLTYIENTYGYYWDEGYKNYSVNKDFDAFGRNLLSNIHLNLNSVKESIDYHRRRVATPDNLVVSVENLLKKLEQEYKSGGYPVIK